MTKDRYSLSAPSLQCRSQKGNPIIFLNFNLPTLSLSLSLSALVPPVSPPSELPGTEKMGCFTPASLYTHKWLTCPEWRSLAEERWGETGQVIISVAERWRRDWREGGWGGVMLGCTRVWGGQDGGGVQDECRWNLAPLSASLLHLFTPTSLSSVIHLFFPIKLHFNLHFKQLNRFYEPKFKHNVITDLPQTGREVLFPFIEPCREEKGTVLVGWLVRVADVFVVNVWLLRITGLCREASYVDTRMGFEKELGQQCCNMAGEEENGNFWETKEREMKKGCGNRLTNNYRANRLSPGFSCPRDVEALQKDKGHFQMRRPVTLLSSLWMWAWAKHEA